MRDLELELAAPSRLYASAREDGVHINFGWQVVITVSEVVRHAVSFRLDEEEEPGEGFVKNRADDGFTLMIKSFGIVASIPLQRAQALALVELIEAAYPEEIAEELNPSNAPDFSNVPVAKYRMPLGFRLLDPSGRHKS